MAKFLLSITSFPLLLPMRMGCGRKARKRGKMPWFWSTAEDPCVLHVLTWRSSSSAPQSHVSSADDNFSCACKAVPTLPEVPRHTAACHCSWDHVPLLHEKHNRPVHKWKVGSLENNIPPCSALGINTLSSFFFLIFLFSKKWKGFTFFSPLCT